MKEGSKKVHSSAGETAGGSVLADRHRRRLVSQHEDGQRKRLLSRLYRSRESQRCSAHTAASCVRGCLLVLMTDPSQAASLMFSPSVHLPTGSMSPPIGPHYLDIPYRSDRRLGLGKSSTLPAQENATPGRCTETFTLPGGATPTHHQRWSNPGDVSPAWGAVQHTCRRPLTEYRAYSQDLAASNGKEWEERHEQGAGQDGSLKQGCKTKIPLKVPRSITDVDLSEPNVSPRESFSSASDIR